jgi:hypothetical protein
MNQLTSGAAIKKTAVTLAVDAGVIAAAVGGTVYAVRRRRAANARANARGAAAKAA